MGTKFLTFGKEIVRLLSLFPLYYWHITTPDYLLEYKLKTYINLHVPKPAHLSETASFLP